MEDLKKEINKTSFLENVFFREVKLTQTTLVDDGMDNFILPLLC